jgi:hypothetical protein
VADPDSPTLTVYLKVSPDGGVTWIGPVALKNGQITQSIEPGKNKTLTWDAGLYFKNQYGGKYRYRVGVADWVVSEQMAAIPRGPFEMGDIRILWRAALPVHKVSVSDFAIDKTEVTIEMWSKIREWGNKNGYDLNEGDADYKNYLWPYPVHSVSWFDVVNWNNARSEKDGKSPVYYENSARTTVYRKGSIEPLGVDWGGEWISFTN